MKDKTHGGKTTQGAFHSARYATCAEMKSSVYIALKYDPTLTTTLMKTLKEMTGERR